MITSSEQGAPQSAAWSSFVRWFLGVLAVTMGSLFAFTVAMDPYGILVTRGEAASPIMDLNQRYMYPQLIRHGQYDSAVFGTSSVRLLDPQRLDKNIGGHFANFGMNAATPWEQMQLANLFVRETPRPRTVIFGIDANWCEADADEKRLTFRSFPPWLYERVNLASIGHQFDLKSLEIAARVAAQRLGLMDERIRGDGYEVFTPPEGEYDLARARMHIWAGNPPTMPIEPPASPSAEEQAAWRFPALPWLEQTLAALPRDTRVMLVFPPAHIAAMPQPGSVLEAREQACKRAITAIGKRHDATVVDFRKRSDVTREDANYWDPLHYRLGIAARLADDISAAENGTSQRDSSFFTILTQRSRREN